MEKLTGNKHNHLFTDLIKVFIFGLMLLLPFLCFLPTGFYYGFNEHATNETTTEINYKYQSNEVNTFDDLVIGNIYHFEFNEKEIDDLWSNSTNLIVNFVNFNSYDLIDLNLEFDDTIYESFSNGYFCSQFFFDSDYALTIYNYYSYNEQENYINALYVGDIQGSTFSINGDFILISCDDLSVLNTSYITYTDYNVIESVETNIQDTISNKMYLAWQGVWQSPLFNWTNTTPLNTGLNGFISIFGINQSSYIANCLIYLLSITAIYVVFDIVLGIFKWLTHLINK